VKLHLRTLRKINRSTPFSGGAFPARFFCNRFQAKLFKPRDAMMDSVFSPRVHRSRYRLFDQATRSVRRIADTLALVLAGAREGLDTMARYNALSRLSDGALAKRGLTRADIARAALENRTVAPYRPRAWGRRD
jgi:hypothetical protein